MMKRPSHLSACLTHMRVIANQWTPKYRRRQLLVPVVGVILVVVVVYSLSSAPVAPSLSATFSSSFHRKVTHWSTPSHKHLLGIFVVFGTRPEVIKLAPVIQAFQSQPERFVTFVCSTGQHREMLQPHIDVLGITVDVDLHLMQKDQTLAGLSSRALERLDGVFNQFRPSLVIVQGDTTTAMITALAAFYHQIPVGHVEAGLRTREIYSPFPEEINRHVVGVVATYHFAPTSMALDALVYEGVDPEHIFLTGNPVIDSLVALIGQPASHSTQQQLARLGVDESRQQSKKLVLVTVHRRESFGAPLRSILAGLRKAAQEAGDSVEFIVPVHMNPRVSGPVRAALSDCSNVQLVDPLPYDVFMRLLAHSYMVVTDSGGIQEEASFLGKPIVILRESTERMEGVKAGASMLVGWKEEDVVAAVQKLLNEGNVYQEMAVRREIYGDGHAGTKISQAVYGLRKSLASAVVDEGDSKYDAYMGAERLNLTPRARPLYNQLRDWRMMIQGQTRRLYLDYNLSQHGLAQSV